MSMNIVYTHTARQDLREIYEYIAFTLLVPDTARSLTDKIMADIRSLKVDTGDGSLCSFVQNQIRLDH